MKTLLTTLLLLLCITCTTHGQGQRLEEYTASNGITYREGNLIKLNRGSNPNGKFVYVTIAGWAVSTDAEANQLPANYSGLNVDIKKIKRYKFKGEHKVLFIIGGGNITNYAMDIEGAIATCEIEDCTDPNSSTDATDKYDQLLKLKALLDAGAITQEEFDLEKAKILNN